MFERFIKRDDFLQLPLSGNKYFINKNGILKYSNGDIVNEFINQEGEPLVCIDWINGLSEYKIALLLAFTFKPVHLPIKYWIQLQVLYADNDCKNYQLSNLVWKYPIGLGSIDYNGFAFIPMFSRYLINKEGAIFEFRSMKIVPCYFNKGYYSYSLKPDIGLRTSLKRHRGIGLVFLDYPNNVDLLQINHIDGVKGNDYPENLEWITGSENRLHAIKTGLTPVNNIVIAKNIKSKVSLEFNTLKEFCSYFNINRKSAYNQLCKVDQPYQIKDWIITYKNLNNTNTTPILVRNTLTGEITEYSSIATCCSTLGISKHVLNYRINTPTSCLSSDYKQFKRKSDLTPWYIPVDPEQELLEYSWKTKILVRNVFTGNITEYESQRALANEIGVTESVITVWLSKDGQPIFKAPATSDLIQIKKKSDKTDWIIHDHPEQKYIPNRRFKIVLTRNIDTGIITEYPNARACANALGIKPTNLNWRLKTKGQKIYNSSLQFKYKNEVTPFYIRENKKL
jgi:hypothetical protein